MKIKKSELARIVREEVAIHAKRLMEAPDISDAQDDQKSKEKKGQKAPPGVDGGSDPKKKPAAGPSKDKEPPVQEPTKEPSDDELEDQSEEDPEEKEKDAKEKVGDAIAGKTVQSITQEPKSKILPGAQEIVVSFDQSPEPLRILVSKSGEVKYFYKGALHNEV